MGMQMNEGMKLREQHAAKGDPYCAHLETSKEYHFGGDTGDRLCNACGHIM
ncbi:hypothetical protein SZ00_02619 [Rhodococcus sp. AD45]|nr:hypothetical protein SZ00_02619 [Rhodococcus sp. AD45]